MADACRLRRQVCQYQSPEIIHRSPSSHFLFFLLFAHSRYISRFSLLHLPIDLDAVEQSNANFITLSIDYYSFKQKCEKRINKEMGNMAQNTFDDENTFFSGSLTACERACRAKFVFHRGYFGMWKNCFLMRATEHVGNARIVENRTTGVFGVDFPVFC